MKKIRWVALIMSLKIVLKVSMVLSFNISVTLGVTRQHTHWSHYKGEFPYLALNNLDIVQLLGPPYTCRFCNPSGSVQLETI